MTLLSLTFSGSSSGEFIAVAVASAAAAGSRARGLLSGMRHIRFLVQWTE